MKTIGPCQPTIISVLVALIVGNRPASFLPQLTLRRKQK